MFEQMPEVIALHNHIVEFEEGHAFFQTFFEAFSSKHTVYGEVNANFTEQLDIVQIHQPVSIIYHNCLIFGEIDETAHLLFETSNVMSDEFRSQHFTHIVFTTGVAYHTGTATQQADGTVTSFLHVAHQHQSDEVTNVQAVSGGVKTNIKSNFLFF